MEGFEGPHYVEDDAELIALREQKARIDAANAKVESAIQKAAEKKLLRMQIKEAGETPCA